MFFPHVEHVIFLLRCVMLAGQSGHVVGSGLEAMSPANISSTSECVGLGSLAVLKSRG